MTTLSMSFSSSTGDPIGLRLAGAEDQDHLRDWRNAHARRFYQQSHVSDESQRRWFEAYLDRPDDFLFMVMEAGHAIGCMGIRFLDREWEVYNVIRGVESTCSKGLMSSALAMMLEFAWRSRPVPVRVEVLADNPALAWYLRNGFVVIDADTRSFRLIHRRQHPLEGGEPMIPVFGSDLGEREIEAVTTCMR
jgi:RimJ/RimL family protein N-acetyltransferase